MVLRGRVAGCLRVAAGLVKVGRGASIVALGMLGLTAGAAWAGDTVAVVINPSSGLVQMVVVPDSDAELADPAYNPPGSVQVRLSKSQFQGATTEQFVARASEAAKQTLKTQIAPLAAPAGVVMTPTEAAAFQRQLIDQAKAR